MARHKPKERKALSKVKASVKHWQSVVEKDRKRAHHSKVQYDEKYLDWTHTKDNHKWHTYYGKLKDKWYKAMKADKARLSRSQARLKAAQEKHSRVSPKQKGDIDAVERQVQEHADGWRNEGKCAIYPSDGTGSPVYIAPTDTESEDVTANVTSYPVDEGAPSSDYARISDKTQTVAGIITGTSRADANQKWARLKGWMNHHKQMTYRGDFCYKHLQITNLQQSFSNLKDNLKVSISFKFVYPAHITRSTGKHNKKKRSRASKTLHGNRKKQYKAITVKTGMTLLGISRKYGKSVAWLQKVNHIKNPNKIDAGWHIYVDKKTGRKHIRRKKVRAK